MKGSETLFSTPIQKVKPRFFYKEEGPTRQDLGDKFYRVAGPETINSRKIKQ